MSQAGCCGGNGSGADDDFLTGNFGGPVGQDINQNTNILGAGGVVVTGNPATHTLTITSAGPQGTIVTIYNSSNTWTKNAATVWVEVIIIGAGAGGGGGCSSDSFDNNMNAGGSGASSDGNVYWQAPASFFGATETVTVAAGGIGGASVTGSGLGNIGGYPGATSFGNIAASATTFEMIANPLLASSGSIRGIAGADDGSGGGQSGIVFDNESLLYPQGNGIAYFGGGSGVFGATLPTQGKEGDDWPFGKIIISTSGPFGSALNAFGGGGGAIGTGGVAEAGGRGSNFYSLLDYTTVLIAGGTAGAINGNAGNGADNTTVSGGLWGAGMGGGGGGSSVAGPGGNGGNGGIPGGPGGGGGSSSAAQPSGAGGNGARGQIIVIEYT